MKQQFTQYGGARPFGVSMMLSGINGKQPQLFVSDVTGNYFAYHANAIGEGDEKIRELLREKYKKDLTIKEGVKVALEIFGDVKADKFNLDKFEMNYISLDDKKIKKAEGKEIEGLK
jgi:proteasome alpha subunit